MSQQINLYNPIFLKQEKHFSARTMAQALGVIALGLAALYAFALVESRTAARTAQQQRDQLALQRDQMVKLGAQLAAQGIDKALEAQVARAESEVKSRRATLDALSAGELGNTAGFSEFFAAFGRQAAPGVWLTSFSIGESGNDLTVHGRALQAELVPMYLRTLNSEAMMRGRQVVEMKLAARVAPPPAPGAKTLPLPERYVEFTFTAPLRVAPPSAAKGKP
jgi:hypothetical protein